MAFSQAQEQCRGWVNVVPMESVVAVEFRGAPEMEPLFAVVSCSPLTVKATVFHLGKHVIFILSSCVTLNHLTRNGFSSASRSALFFSACFIIQWSCLLGP